MRLASRPHGNLNVLTKSSEKVHKALDRKGAGLAPHKAGNAGLVDFPYSRLKRRLQARLPAPQR